MKKFSGSLALVDPCGTEIFLSREFDRLKFIVENHFKLASTNCGPISIASKMTATCSLKYCHHFLIEKDLLVWPLYISRYYFWWLDLWGVP